jgi:hypothetical protein
LPETVGALQGEDRKLVAELTCEEFTGSLLARAIALANNR